MGITYSVAVIEKDGILSDPEETEVEEEEEEVPWEPDAGPLSSEEY